MTPMRAPDASASTQATPVTSRAHMPQLVQGAQPTGTTLPSLADAEKKYAIREEAPSPSASPVARPAYTGERMTSNPAIPQPTLPPLGPATGSGNFLDPELMLAAQILSDDDYAAYLTERRRNLGGGPQR